MDDSCLAMSKTKTRAITSGNADRYLASETADLTAGERSLFQFLKTHLFWDEAKRGTLKTIPLSVKLMAERQGVSTATIRRRLSGLREAGEVRIVERFSGEGRQLASEFIFPKLTVWLNELKVSDVVDALTEGREETDQTRSEGEGVSDETPIKQGSYSKKNTYMRFLTKEDFLGVTGSVRYVPQLLGIIRKMRPGVCPDVIFRYFKEWISSDGFVLKSGKTFIGLLFQFSRWCKIPYINGFTPRQSTEPQKPAEPVDYSDIKPVGDDVVSVIRRQIFDQSPSVYRAWFHKTSIRLKGDVLEFCGETGFVTGYLSQNFDQMLRHIAGARGLTARFAA